MNAVADRAALEEIAARRGWAWVVAQLTNALDEASDGAETEAAGDVWGDMAHEAHKLATELRRYENKEARRGRAT